MKLILASASPRRANLLRQCGISFEIDAPDVSEDLNSDFPPDQIATRLALKKACAVAKRHDRGIIVAADTLVLHQGKVLGKPVDQRDARQMLKLLSGDVHEVITAIALVEAASKRSTSAVAVTRVWFRTLAESEIDAYIATGEPLDKAGAYGIQGCAALFVDKLEGCYFNVVGLPLSLLNELLKKFSNINLVERKDYTSGK